jgi:LAS superfamily LD-carboxypeptidase LdcB
MQLLAHRRLLVVALLLTLCHQRMVSQAAVADSLAPYTREELLGKFSPAKHPDFLLIEQRYSTKTDIYLRMEAYDSFKRMHNAALKEGITLTILSATRNFDAQKTIWEKKWVRPQYKGKTDVEKASDIMKYSSMPGTSRHHWGTDIDMNSLENSYFTSGEGKKMYEWLLKNAATYGFYQPLRFVCARRVQT